ncbi:MAG: SPFH domain-containing protein [Planctomycetota bacterium]
MTQPTDPNQPATLTPRPMGTSEEIAAAAKQAEQLGDDAGKSLADALRISFGVLRWLIVLLVIAFLFSGFFTVRSDEVAVRTRFGKITQDGEGRGYLTADGGPYFQFPAPVDEIIRIPTTTQTIEVRNAFWYEEQVSGTDVRPNPATNRQLRIGIDGSLITGDGNLVHGRFTVNYRVRPEDAVAFVKAVGETETGEPIMVRAQQIVTIAAERAISAAVAEVTAIEFLQSSPNTALIRAKLSEILNEQMNTGITVESVIADNRVAPPGVQESFDAVQTAVAQRQSEILKAQQDREARLSEAAGKGYDVLLAVMDIYGDAGRDDETELRAAATEALNALLDGIPANQATAPLLPMLDDEDRAVLEAVATNVTVGGEASEVINAAEQYRLGRVEQVRAKLERFEGLLATYESQPDFTRRRLLQQMRQSIFAKNPELMYFDGKMLRMDIPRDTGIDKRRAEEEAEASRLAAEAARRNDPSARVDPNLPPGAPGR